MNFKEYMSHAWSIHKTEPKVLAEGFKTNFALMESPEDVMAMSRLIVHVCGQHLGEWERGIDLLKKIKNNATISDKAEMNRLTAILTLGNNPNTSIEHFSPSDQVRIYSATASALADLGGLKNAEKFFNKSLEMMKDMPATDEANSALAKAGNNIALTLEEKSELKPHEVELMITAAIIARKYWEVAGTWLEVERAEYRLAQTFIKAQKLDLAMDHAENCLEIVNANGRVPLESFFAYESLAIICKMIKNQMGLTSAMNGMNTAFDQLSSEDQQWCKASLDKLL